MPVTLALALALALILALVLALACALVHTLAFVAFVITPRVEMLFLVREHNCGNHHIHHFAAGSCNCGVLAGCRVFVGPLVQTTATWLLLLLRAQVGRIWRARCSVPPWLKW